MNHSETTLCMKVCIYMTKVSDEEVFVDTWLMSCRVLKRGMEEFIVNKMIQSAKEHGYKKVSAEYIPTAKNSMVADIYKTMGFNEAEENKYWVNVEEYIEKENFIAEEE